MTPVSKKKSFRPAASHQSPIVADTALHCLCRICHLLQTGHGRQPCACAQVPLSAAVRRGPNKGLLISTSATVAEPCSDPCCAVCCRARTQLVQQVATPAKGSLLPATTRESPSGVNVFQSGLTVKVRDFARFVWEGAVRPKFPLRGGRLRRARDPRGARSIDAGRKKPENPVFGPIGLESELVSDLAGKAG